MAGTFSPTYRCVRATCAKVFAFLSGPASYCPWCGAPVVRKHASVFAASPYRGKDYRPAFSLLRAQRLFKPVKKR